MQNVWNGRRIARRHRARRIAIGGLTVLIATGASAAMPPDEVPLGDLMCRLQNAGAEATPSVQVYEIVCVYRPAEGGIEEHYTGTLSAIGPGDPLKDNKVLTWVVRGPQALDARPGVLAQRYGAVPERPDGAARSLLGDTRTSIVLRESTPPQTSSSATAPVIAAMQLKLQMAIALFGPVAGTGLCQPCQRAFTEQSSSVVQPSRRPSR
jgi:hypothetical protein